MRLETELVWFKFHKFSILDEEQIVLPLALTYLRVYYQLLSFDLLADLPGKCFRL